MKTVYDKTNSILNIYQDIKNQQQDTNQLLNEMKQAISNQMANQDDKLQHLLMNHLGKIVMSVFGLILIPTIAYFWNLSRNVTILEKNYERHEIEILKNDAEHKLFIEKIEAIPDRINLKIDEQVRSIISQDKKVYSIEQTIIHLKEKVNNIEEELKNKKDKLR